MNPQVKEIIKLYWKELQKKPNVIGYSHDLKNRQKNGVLIPETQVFRIYVTRKLPLKELNANDIIPRMLGLPFLETKDKNILRSVETDVVEIGEIKTLSVDKTAKFRPVEIGVSVGNWAITAGSLGMLYKDAEGNLYAGSNAHVLTDGDASKTPEEIVEKRILQPGSYHAGQTEDNVVGTYFWHERIIPIGISTCPIGTGFASLINFALKLFKRHGILAYQDTSENFIDFAVYKPSVEHIMKIADDSIDIKLPFVGHLFGGSEQVAVYCKIAEILKARPDIKPLNNNWSDIQDGDNIKCCSFWCHYEGKVIDANAAINVNYGNFVAFFTNVFLVENDGTVKGGYSGSGGFKV